MKVSVKSNTNIALVKYWGKRNSELKTPLNNSISLTLDSLYTTTEIEIIENEKDEITFNGNNILNKESQKIINFIDIFRNKFNKNNLKFRINTSNNFPTASGLASSASGFSALTVSLDKIMNLNLSEKELSIFSRIGSGSASRSIFGGFAEWHKGILDNGKDSFAEQIVDENYWDIRMLVVILEDKKKSKSSTDGMEETVRTCPFYKGWLDSIENDLNKVRNGIIEKDIEKVGSFMEHNCLKMHSTMFTTIPYIIYWTPSTLEVIHKVKYIREKLSLNCYFTIDAGANVKILCLPNDVKIIKESLSEINSIKQIIECKPGKAPQINVLS